MKAFIIAVFCILGAGFLRAQDKPLIYNPQADAAADIRAAVQKAAAEGKHVFLQVGGNWCPWCIRFHRFVHEDRTLDSLMNAGYVSVLVNYSPENKNTALLSSLGYPERFGFPVFVILDGKGERLHTQDSWYLEQEKSYSREKVQQFFRMWSPVTLEEAAAKAAGQSRGK
jgi:thioredoxin-related protein